MKDIFGRIGFIQRLNSVAIPSPGPLALLCLLKLNIHPEGWWQRKGEGGERVHKGFRPAALKIRTMRLCFTSEICFICSSAPMGTFIVEVTSRRDEVPAENQL